MVFAGAWKVCAGLFAIACLHAVALAAQEESSSPPVRMHGSWVVTVEGEPRTRTLSVRSAQPAGANVWTLDALYGWSDGRAVPARATLTVAPGKFTLQFVTGADSEVVAESSDLAVFTGTFTPRSGKPRPVRLARLEADTGGSAPKAEPAPDLPLPAWAARVAWTVVYREFAREVARRSYEVVTATDTALIVLTWPGALDARPPKARRIRLLVLDRKSGLFGPELYDGAVTFSPLEPWGCAPVQPGRACLDGPFRFDVSNRPTWQYGEVREARFAARTETYRIEGTGEQLEVLRFFLRVQRNNGWYTREILHSPALPYPVHSVSRLDGAREVSSSIVEYRRLD